MCHHFERLQRKNVCSFDPYNNKECYPYMMKLLKLDLLITPRTPNLKYRFSIPMLLITEHRNSQTPKSIDQLRSIVLLGP